MAIALGFECDHCGIPVVVGDGWWPGCSQATIIWPWMLVICDRCRYDDFFDRPVNEAIWLNLST